MELRCPVRLHGMMIDEHTLEVSCRSSRCGWRSGTLVLHRFDIRTGEVKETKRYRDPGPLAKEKR